MKDKKNPRGRPKNRPIDWWLNGSRSIAWYHFVEMSGVDFRKIRIEYSVDGMTKYYKDRDKQWKRWKNGRGEVEESVLNKINEKVPGSKKVYISGPLNSSLWLCLEENISYDKILKFDKENCSFPDNLTKELQLALINKPAVEYYNELKKVASNLGIDLPNLRWRDLAYSILMLRLRFSLKRYPLVIPVINDSELMGISESLYENAEVYFKSCLESSREDLILYGLDPQDIIFQILYSTNGEIDMVNEKPASDSSNISNFQWHK